MDVGQLTHKHVWYHCGTGFTFFDEEDRGRLDWCRICGALRDDKNCIIETTQPRLYAALDALVSGWRVGRRTWELPWDDALAALAAARGEP